MDLKNLIAVEKWTYGLALVAIVLAFMFGSAQAAWSLSLGAALMSANAFSLRRIGERAFLTMKRPAAWVLLFNLKMAAMLALVFVIIKYLHVAVGAFMVGLSVFPLAVVATAIAHSLRTDEEAESNG